MKNLELNNLLNMKEKLKQKLESMIYGTVEIRESDNKKYIYVHFRDNGRLRTKYAGEYTDELYNLILNNNLEVKEIKKEIRKIDRILKKENFNYSDLSKKVKLNIDLAKRNLVDTIYNQAILEGIVTTFADTENIIEGAKVNGMTPTDIMKIVNLKRAWEFILNESVILSPENFDLLSEINKITIEGFYYNAGKIRNVPVKIGGSSYVPPMPVMSIIKKDLEYITNKKLSVIDRAIEYLLYVMKSQIFIDGNKRTAVIFANHYLIKKGKGIICIPSELTEEYKKLLISYYEGHDINNIKEFLKNKCYIEL